MKSRNILHIVAPAEVGGLERVVQALSIGQRRLGHRVSVAAVVTPDSSPDAFVTPMRAADVDVHVVELGARSYFTERRRIAELLARIRPDVVHTHGYRPDLLHGPVARRARIPVVSTVHGSSRLGGVTHFYEWLQERVLRRFDAVIAVSRPLGDALRRNGIPDKRLHVVPNAWAPLTQTLDRDAARARLGLDPAAFVIGWVGRLIPAKGCDVFLDALARVDRARDWQACIVGHGPELPMLQEQAARLDLGSRVRFCGGVAEAAQLYRAFDVFALSSRTEGTPIVLFEAVAAGVPVVVTSVGGVPDVITGNGGLIVPPLAPHALAAALEDVRSRPAQATERAGFAKRRLEDVYGTEQWLSQHEAVYASARQLTR